MIALGNHRGTTGWALAAILTAVGACAAPGGGGWGVIGSAATSLRIESRDRDAWMAPAYVTGVYRAIDENTADIYLSDIEEDRIIERLRSGNAAPDGAVVTHIRLFLSPVAGKTPIDFTASNCTITHVVLTGGAATSGVLGVYGGGGFLLPDGPIGANELGGRIKGASLKLLRSDDGFADLLGLAELSGRVRVRRDDTLADTIAARLALLMKR